MDIERLRLFVTVADCLNFTKAAEKMYISQPTLSRHIADLEDALQVELFERTTRKVSLTTAGKLFYHEAKQIIKNYDALILRATRLGNGLSGSLKVGYLELFTQDILPVAIRNFTEKFPMVELSLRETKQSNAQSMLLDNSLDIAFIVTRSTPIISPELYHQRIFTGELELIVSRFHPYANYQTVSPSILRDEQILTFDQDETPELRENITKICMEHHFMPNIHVGDYSPGSIFLLVQAGVGVSLLSSLVTSVLRTGDRFCSLKLEGIYLPTNLEIAWRKDNDNPCIQNFLREVTEAAHPDNSESKA